MVKFFIFQMSERWFLWQPKGVCVFVCVCAIASRLNTLDLKLDMCNYLWTSESLKKFRGISDIFDVFMTSLMSDFYVNLQFLATASVIKCVETFEFSHRLCVLTGSTTLLSLMCNRL